MARRTTRTTAAAALAVASLLAAATPATATSKPPPTMATGSLKIICAAAGAKIGRDTKTVQCLGGRIYRAAAGKKFIVAGPYVVEIDSGGLLGPARMRPVIDFPPAPGWPGGYDPPTSTSTETIDGRRYWCENFLSGRKHCVMIDIPDDPPVKPGGTGVASKPPSLPLITFRVFS